MTASAKDDAAHAAAPSARGAEAVLAEGEGASRRTPLPVLKIRWTESWIIRAAALASFILFLGFATSAFFTFESIDSIAKLAHDDEIEASLSARLGDLKKIHDLQQELILERLSPFALKAAAENGPNAVLSDAEAHGWMKAAKVELMAPPGAIEITAAAGKVAPDDLKSPIKWIDRDRLKVLGRIWDFPKGPVYEAFKAAEDVKQRYQLVGAKLNEDIRPTFVRASSLILIVSFFLLASIFVLYARRFTTMIGQVIEGFATWSEKDANFRFDEVYRGELKLITSQFNAMADEVEANRQRSLFLEKIASWQIIARKLAHEIKNPLTPIQMMVSQLKRRYKGEDKDFAKLLDNAQSIITEEVSGLRRMVDNFSNFARLPQPELRTIDLANVCRHVVELEKNVFPQHTIEFRGREAKAAATADDDLLRQVMINLIKNAGEACGETAARIAVGLDDGGADWLVTVTDNGPGIPDDLKDRIFEAYFTTKHTGPNPGMGLGLAVCQKIVMDHGGKMTVRSRPGETVFTIRIPKNKKETSAQ